MIKRVLDSVLPAILLAISFAQFTPAQEKESTLLKGKVLDSAGKPISGAKIIIHNEDSHQELSGRSDGDGDFEIEHAPCSSLSFDVIPSKKSGFTSAHYAHVGGESSKHFIVQLHKGFQVSGRVLAEGQGIKGLEIHAFGHEPGTHSTVHGGGKTKSNNNGEFTLFLTPGKKTIQIKNDIYSNLSPVYQHEFTITGDTRLPDMTLPLQK
ncbi:MAG: carboxypeptidase-like regulatory domain-containing protein [Candidatus Obscuribacterales bacterium]|nr:carboxypeptidase-like regulatory domain-containing protein [Candidatus Obscuribacterales bacterium]